jgi:hypothetical protein
MKPNYQIISVAAAFAAIALSSGAQAAQAGVAGRAAAADLLKPSAAALLQIEQSIPGPATQPSVTAKPWSEIWWELGPGWLEVVK